MLFPRKRGWIGIDVGTSSVNLAQLVRREDRILLGATGTAFRGHDDHDDHDEHDEHDEQNSGKCSVTPFSSAGELSKAQLLGTRWRGRSSAICTSMSICDVFPANNLATSELQDASMVAANVQKAALYPIDGREIAWWPANGPNDNGTRALVASMPSVWSQRLTEDVSNLNLDCRTIDATPWCLARAIGLVEVESQTPSLAEGWYAALDWGDQNATACLYRDGEPVQVRCIKQSGYYQLINLVVSKLKCSPREARKLLSGMESIGGGKSGTPGGSSVALARLVEPALEKLEHELRRTLDYWQSQTRGELPQRLYLFGGGATLPGIASRLQSAVRVETRVWELDRSADSQERLPSCLYGAAAGLSALAWERA